MRKHVLPICLIAFLVPTAPVRAQDAREVAAIDQRPWCLELIAGGSWQAGVDLEPHHAALLAACAEQAAGREEPASTRFALERAASTSLIIHTRSVIQIPDLSCPQTDKGELVSSPDPQALGGERRTIASIEMLDAIELEAAG